MADHDSLRFLRCVVETTTLPTKKFQFAFDFLLGASTLRLAVIHFFWWSGGSAIFGGLASGVKRDK